MLVDFFLFFFEAVSLFYFSRSKDYLFSVHSSLAGTLHFVHVYFYDIHNSLTILEKRRENKLIQQVGTTGYTS